jgi:hypothetical protein
MMMSSLVAPASPKIQEQQGTQQFGRKIRKTSNKTYNTHTHREHSTEALLLKI